MDDVKCTGVVTSLFAPCKTPGNSGSSKSFGSIPDRSYFFTFSLLSFSPRLTLHVETSATMSLKALLNYVLEEVAIDGEEGTSEVP